MAPRFPACDWVNGRRHYSRRKEYMWTSRRCTRDECSSVMPGRTELQVLGEYPVERSSRQIRNDYETLQSTLNSGCSPGGFAWKWSLKACKRDESSSCESWRRRESHRILGNTNFLAACKGKRGSWKTLLKVQTRAYASGAARGTQWFKECEGEWHNQQRSHKWSLEDIHWIWSQGYH